MQYQNICNFAEDFHGQNNLIRKKKFARNLGMQFRSVYNT